MRDVQYLTTNSLYRIMRRRRDSPPARPKRQRNQPARLRSESPPPARRRQSRIDNTPSRSPSPQPHLHSYVTHPTNPPPTVPTQLPHPTTQEATAALVANTINAMQTAFAQQQQVFIDTMQNLQSTLIAATSPTHTITSPQPSTSAALHDIPASVGACLTSNLPPPSAIPNSASYSTPGVGACHTLTSADPQGEPLSLVYQPTIRPLRTTAAPLGHSIPHSIKLKIWQHKYIELHDLITTIRSTDYTLALTTEDGEPQFRLAPKKKKALTENQWCQAMDTFIAIYVQRYPHEIGAILSYAQTVKDLMANKANWIWYDQQFRTDREFSLCKWDEVRQDLELRAFRHQSSAYDNNNKPFRSSTSSRRSEDKVPPGYCYAYHTAGQRCNAPKCTYKHNCPKCRGPHPAFMRCSKPATNSARPRHDSRRESRDRSPKGRDSRETRKAQ